MDGKRRGEIIYTVGTYLLRMYFVIDKNSRREKIHSDNIYTSSIHPLSTLIANKLYALALRDVDPQKVLHTYLGGARLHLNCFPVQPWTSMGPLEKRLLFRPQSKEPTGNVLSYLVANSVWREEVLSVLNWGSQVWNDQEHFPFMPFIRYDLGRRTYHGPGLPIVIWLFDCIIRVSFINLCSKKHFAQTTSFKEWGDAAVALLD